MGSKTFISIGEGMAELQLAEAGRYSLKFGGDTLNTAWYMRALTRADQLSVEYLTRVGTEQLSRDLLDFLQRHHIGTRFVKDMGEWNLGLYLITLVGAERHFTYWRSASAARHLADDAAYLGSCLGEARIIYFSGITLAILEPPQRQVLLQVLQEMKTRGATVAFDSNARRRLWASDSDMRAAMEAGYRVASLALPTFEDDRMMFGDASASDCARRIAGYGVGEVIVKDGAGPSIVLANGGITAIDPPPVSTIVDTTGAGDSFNAGYMAGRLAGLQPEPAAELAHRVAARVIGARGALLDMSGVADLAPDYS